MPEDLRLVIKDRQEKLMMARYRAVISLWLFPLRYQHEDLKVSL